MTEWNVYVPGVGTIGIVHEESHGAARCAALSKYGEEGERRQPHDVERRVIFENDYFEVLRR